MRTRTWSRRDESLEYTIYDSRRKTVIRKPLPLKTSIAHIYIYPPDHHTSLDNDTLPKPTAGYEAGFASFAFSLFANLSVNMAQLLFVYLYLPISSVTIFAMVVMSSGVKLAATEP